MRKSVSTAALLVLALAGVARPGPGSPPALASGNAPLAPLASEPRVLWSFGPLAF